MAQSKTLELTLTLKDYKQLYDRLYVSLCAFANKYVKSLEASEDIVQEVFIKTWEDKDKITFQNLNMIQSYLYTSVRNRALNFLKSNHHRLTFNYSIADIEKMEGEEFFLCEIAIVETHELIRNAVDELPNRCSQIIKLSIEEYTIKEIAFELGLSTNTVKAQKRIAYNKLRGCLNFLRHSLTFF